MTSPIVTVENVGYTIGSEVILQDISFRVTRGEIVTIIGPNGSGKTTLIKIILSLIQPNSGRVILDHGLRMGYVPQTFHVDNYLPLTVRSFLDLDKKHNDFQIAELTNIGHLMHRPLQGLSGGELRRVMTARALLRGQDLLVLDEPVSSLDLHQKDLFYKMLHAINQSFNCAIIMVSHDLLMIMRNTDKVLCINKILCCADTPVVVAQHPAFTGLFGDRVGNIALYDHKHKCPEEVRGR